MDAPGTRHVHPDTLALHPRNPRIGNIQAISESLIVLGLQDALIVNKGTLTGRPNEVLAGNHRLIAIRELAAAQPDDPRWAHLSRQQFPPSHPYWRAVEIREVDLDEETATRWLHSNNRTGDLGSYDDALVLDQLQQLPDLEGTGWTDLQLEALADLVAGAPDLDDLADEVGEPTEDDHLVAVRLMVEPHLRGTWNTFRKDFSDDTTAFAALLEQAGA